MTIYYTSSRTISLCCVLFALIVTNYGVVFGLVPLFSVSVPLKAPASSSSMPPPSPPPSKDDNSDTAIPSTQQQQHDDDDGDDETTTDTAWNILSNHLTMCIIQSDLKRDSGQDGGCTGWTSWVDEPSSYRLQQCIDKLTIVDINQGSTTTQSSSSNNNNKFQNDDDIIRWLKWIKSSPTPMIIELSPQIRSIVNSSLTMEALEMIEQTQSEVLNRISLRLILLPSGRSLKNNLQTEPGAMIYGKLLYGGVTRYRVIGSSTKKRKAGERTEIAVTTNNINNNAGSGSIMTRSWLQYGGPERNYDAVDIGPCAFIELTMLPKGSSLPLVIEDDTNLEMAISPPIKFNPRFLFRFPPPVDDESNHDSDDNLKKVTGDDEIVVQDSFVLDNVESKFRNVVGGLGNEIDAIIRRVLDGRILVAPQQGVGQNGGESSAAAAAAAELQQMLDLGLHPVKGLLLYGPPGCGKSQIASLLSQLLTDRPPKIVAAPELLDRWVGGSEKLVRDLFGDAEDELRYCNGDITKSGLHVVVIDEVDAVFRKRSSASDSGEVSRASAVNQILAKLDGVNSLGNILVIGTTNRRELLDDALLRPGRLEVQVEVPLPTKEGRREILQIHFDALRKRGRLSKPLCQAIDGISSSLYAATTSGTTTGDSSSFFRKQIGRFTSFKARPRKLVDLAADRWTKDMSGADIAGLVRCAGSIALARARKDGSGIDGLLVTVDDVIQALEEVKQ